MITLLVVTVLVMLTGALFKSGLLDDLNGTRFRDKSRARAMARAGLNHVLYELGQNSGYATTIDRVVDDESYHIEFSPGHSINNLTGNAPSTTLDCRGQSAPPGSADLLVLARAGICQARLHAVASRGFFFHRGVGADGRITINGNASLDGVTNLATMTPAGGGLFSNYVTTGASDPAVNVSSSSFTMSPQSLIETRPASSGTAVLGVPATYANRVVQSATPADSIPQFQVSQMVSQQSSLLAPKGVVPVGSNYAGSHLLVNSNNYVNGNLTLVGDINLAGGTLYVKGNLDLSGGIVGAGSVFVDGNVTIAGGVSALQTNQTSGAALFSSANVSLQGIDSYTYLQNLANLNPAIRADMTSFQSALSTMYSAFSSASSANYQSPWSARSPFLSPTPQSSSNYRLIPIPNPDGTYSVASNDNSSLTLAADIRNALGSNFTTTPQAVQLVKNLEEFTYAMRSNYNYVPANMVVNAQGMPTIDSNYHVSGGIPTALPSSWGDGVLMVDYSPTNPNATSNYANAWSTSDIATNAAIFNNLSLDHQYRALCGTGTSLASPNDLNVKKLANSYLVAHQQFAQRNPADLSWLGSSNFQGLIYAGGNINVSNNFQIIGALLSNANVTLTGGAQITYNQEYFRQQGAAGTFLLQFVEELP
ncbi:hypothetical protein JST97_06055 [bacterium]|nr:hypothetical protein [bacterium]